jgi:hypothetical protein
MKNISNQELLLIASKYNKPNDMVKNNPDLYREIQRRKLLNDVVYVMGKRPTYSNEDIMSEGAKYDSPTDFKNGNSKMYSVAVQRKLTKLINYKKGFRITYHSDNDIIEGGLRYDNPAEYAKNEPKLYSAGQKRGLLSKINYKVGYIGNIVKRLVYVYEFDDNSAYVGLTYNENKRKSEHIGKRETSVKKHINKTGLTPKYKVISNGYIDAMKAAIMEEKYRQHYKNNGWKILNQRKGGALGGHARFWTEDKIISAASRCNTREEFKNLYSGAFNASKELKIYDYVTEHMDYMLNYFTMDDIIIRAKKYETIEEFREENETMYQHLVRRDDYKDLKKIVFKHMINGRCNSLILDTQTGVYYLGVKEAHHAKNLKVSINTLQSYLSGRRTNKTSLILV